MTQEESLLMNIGMQWKWKLQLWKTLMFGLWLTNMTPLEKHIMLSSTWDFKCRWYPDGFIKKFKAQFCAQGNNKFKGTDLFKTYAMIVQEWTTIWLMFILEILLRLKSKQGYVTCAFLHGELEPSENVYVEMPLGFSQYAKMEPGRFSNWTRPYMNFGRALEHFWKYITRSLKSVDWNNPNLSPVSLLEIRWYVLSK